MHFTDEFGMLAITKSGRFRKGTYVTHPNEVKGLNSTDVESALEIEAGRGAYSTTFEVPSSQLMIPSNGQLTSGGRVQYQLDIPVNVQKPFQKTGR